MEVRRFNNLGILHRDLYKHALEEAAAYFNHYDEHIQTYAMTFQKWLPETFTSCDRGKLLKECEKSDIVLFGDFHTLRQTQRALSRTLFQMQHIYPQRGLVLALECFQSKDQKLIDQFMQDEISEETFLKAISYENTWGFPWPHFHKLLLTSKALKIKVYGINAEYKEKSLDKRDKHMSRCLNRILKNHSNHTVFTLVGEFHLAPSHLPKHLQSSSSKNTNCKITNIVTNIDKYYFKLRTNQKTHGSEYLWLNDNTYCIINTPPWIKWKSFTMFEEMRGVIDTISDEFTDHDEMDEENELFTEITFDVESNILKIIEIVTKFLHILMDKSTWRQLENFHVVYLNDLETYFQQNRIKLPEKSEREIFEKCQKEGVYYLKDHHLIILTDLNSNHLAEAAGQHIFHVFGEINGRVERNSKFIDDVISYAAGLFASKVINPKRGFMILPNFKGYLNLNREKKLKGKAKEKRLIAKAVIKIEQYLAQDTGLSFPPSVQYADRVTFGGVTRGIGQIIGYNLFCLALRSDRSKKKVLELITGSHSYETDEELFRKLWHFEESEPLETAS